MHNRSQSRGRLHLSKITLFGVPYIISLKKYAIIISLFLIICIFVLYIIFLFPKLYIYTVLQGLIGLSINDYTIK